MMNLMQSPLTGPISRDLREMGRATSAVLKGLDTLNSRTVLVATTNLYEAFDKALIRRFDNVVDLIAILSKTCKRLPKSFLRINYSSSSFGDGISDLFRKMIALMDLILTRRPEESSKSAIAFSNPNEEFDYLARLFKQYNQVPRPTTRNCRAMGFPYVILKFYLKSQKPGSEEFERGRNDKVLELRGKFLSETSFNTRPAYITYKRKALLFPTCRD